MSSSVSVMRECATLALPLRQEQATEAIAPRMGSNRFGNGAAITVIASAAKQSRLSPRRDSGLLRCARNDECLCRQFIVGIENSAPSLTPDGQREVTVLVLV
jgi:hypothetical protein